MNKRVSLIVVLLTMALALVIVIPAFAGARGGNLVDPAPPPTVFPHNGYGVWLADSMEGGPILRDANAQWVTLFVNWSSVEQVQGQYDWSNWDSVLGKAATEGYQVVLTINGNPSWAADTNCGPIRQEHLADYAAFLSAAVRRYSAPPFNIKYWSLYNEPDNTDSVNFSWLGGCWGNAGNPNAAPGAGGAAYANMLKQVYPAMKAANPDVYVVLGGLAYDYFIDLDGGIFDPAFLDDLLAAGGGDYFDVINFHYYPFGFQVRWEPEPFDRYNRHVAYKARWLANEVYRVTGQRKPIMNTETGETSHNKDGIPDYRRQILAIYQSFLEGQMVNVYPTIWFTGIDLQFSISYDHRRYGLLNLDGSPKPSYYAFKAMADELGEATFVRPRDDLPARFEGYEFNDRGRTKTVLWMYPDYEGFPPPQPVDIIVSQPGGSLRVVKVRTDVNGDDDLNIVSEYTVTDGGQGDGDGWANGKVRVQIDQDIRFFEDLSMPAYTPTPVVTPEGISYLPLFYH